MPEAAAVSLPTLHPLLLPGEEPPVPVDELPVSVVPPVPEAAPPTPPVLVVLLLALPPVPDALELDVVVPIVTPYWKAPMVFPPSVLAMLPSGCTYCLFGTSEKLSALPGATPMPIAGEPAFRW